MPVWEGGGNMIQDVTFEQVVYQPAPNKFEAGTGNIADAVGLGAALEYVERLGIHNIARYEHDLLEYGQHALSSVAGLRPIGTAKNKASVMSFTLEGYSTEQVGKALNQHGIAVRSGHHCAQPILRRFGVEQTVRPSLAFYNTTEEIDLLVSVLHQLAKNKRSSNSLIKKTASAQSFLCSGKCNTPNQSYCNYTENNPHYPLKIHPKL
jgi:cysteine desulfurase/selenocysteine lyase